MSNAAAIRRGSRLAGLLAGAAVLALARGAEAQTAPPTQVQAPAPAANEVVVTASRRNLMGVAVTASQGSVTEKELELRPVYRVGQLLESTPGLVVTVHSGEGKANQYLVRGFNLDHGTDIANFIDDMPINRPTNAHGQGYSDLNFMIPQMAQGLDYTKGPYYAEVGDFGAVVSTHMKLANETPSQIEVTGGALGVYNIFAGGSHELSPDDRVTGGLYYGHVDGPYTHPDDFRKYAGEARYSHGTANNGYSLTAMYFKGDGNMTTDQPLRAVQEGLIGRYGSLDPSDGSSSERFSLSAHDAFTTENWKVVSSAYYIHSRMTLWNDFTHFLEDPIKGDQEAQNETRDVVGGQTAGAYQLGFDDIQNEITVGLQVRYDSAFVDRQHTYQRQVLNYCEAAQVSGSPLNPVTIYSPFAAVDGHCQADQVTMLDLGPYVDVTTHWTHWLRTVFGVREEYYGATDHSLISGQSFSGNQTLLQPKGSVVIGPIYQTELYLSAGRGFHSDDVRGVFGTVPIEGEPVIAGKTPLLAPADGMEVGLRVQPLRRLQVQIAVFQEDFKSELRYDADQGQDAASAPSRRQGVELSGEYHPTPWMELNSDLAFSKARYQGGATTLASFGLNGPYIANAPSFIGSFGVLIDNIGPWFAGLQWRDLGPYPVLDGENTPQDKGYSEFNADLGYKINDHLKIQASGFNLLNEKANSAAYYYTARIQGEPAGGIAGMQVHPLEPISGQMKVTYLF